VAKVFLRQALRYRLSQTLALAGVSLLIGTCAAFAPWFARAVEQTVTTETLTNQWLSSAWQLDASPPRAVGGPTAAKPPEELEQLLPADLRPKFTAPVHGLTVELKWGLKGQSAEIEGPLVWRDDYCARLVLAKGRCPARAGEVAGRRTGSAVDRSATPTRRPNSRRRHPTIC
jgi:hypothetical protein